MKNKIIAFYAFSSLTILLQIFPGTTLSGIITLIAAFIISKRLLKAEGIYKSHAIYARKTLTFGTYVLLPVFLIAAMTAIYFASDFTPVYNAMDTDTIENLPRVLHDYAIVTYGKALKVMVLAMATPVFWWLRRNIVGMWRVREGLPIENPESRL